MISRKYYLEKIQPYLGKPVVKAITGLRRVGKSVFVRQLIEHLRIRELLLIIFFTQIWSLWILILYERTKTCMNTS